MRAVVAGWFSYTQGHATAGDILACKLLTEWLTEWGIDYIVAVAPPFTKGVPLDSLNASDFTHAFFVCGPFGRKPLEGDFLRRFANCRLIGLNLSFETEPTEWKAFDFYIERDSGLATHPDIVFGSREELPPVVGVCLVEPHPGAEVALANQAIERLLNRHHAARVLIDTRLDTDNEGGLRTPGEIEALIARCDILVTTRLHGLVMALKNGVPVLAVDTVPGSGKLTRQCRRVRWPNLLGLADLSDERMDAAFLFALSEDARSLTIECGGRAFEDVQSLRQALYKALAQDGLVDEGFGRRTSPMALANYMAALPFSEEAGTVRQPKRGFSWLQRLIGR